MITNVSLPDWLCGTVSSARPRTSLNLCWFTSKRDGLTQNGENIQFK